MSNLIKHAKKELELAGMFDKDSDYNGDIGKAVMKLMEVFSEQGHSGCSAAVTLSLFSKLADFKPITSLTLADDEWNNVYGDTFQNKRNSSVFKEGKDTKPYYGDAYTKRTPDGNHWHGCLKLKDGSIMSQCFIKDVSKMPTIVIDVEEKEVTPDDWEMWVKDESQLDELAKYYDFTFNKQQTTKQNKGKSKN